MKRMFATLLLGLFVAAPAFAVNQDNTGCGLGTNLMQDKDGMVWEILAATTNASASQTFGMSSGTLGCEKNPTFSMREKLDVFVADNMDALAVDIAMGEGETLGTLAELAEVDEDRKADFFAALQMNFDQIYPDGSVESNQVVDTITVVIERI